MINFCKKAIGLFDKKSRNSRMNLDRPRSSNPQQVSADQESPDKSLLAFSSGATFSQHSVENIGSRRDHPSQWNTTQRREYNHEREASTRSTNAHRPPIPARHPEYVEYSQRLRSFARWTLRQPDTHSLCDAGFFFTNQSDLVRCFQCGIGLKDFSDGDDPLFEHVRYSQNCPFLVEHIGHQRLSAIKKNIQAQQTESSVGLPQQTFGNTPSTSSCRHPGYQSIEARVSSFSGWPRHMMQTPRELAEAGLYFTGFDDQVRCFMCDGGLRRWDPEDVPWTEHCRWFPACPFARDMKGDEFIALVRASANYINGPQENELHVSNTNDLTNAVSQMTLRDTEVSSVLQKHKDKCLEMGYKIEDINGAVEEITKIGNMNPNVDEILDIILNRQERQRTEISSETTINVSETPLEENRRLKSFLTCAKCDRNEVNILLLPCKHHRFCMDCAEPLAKCPLCDKHIRQKIRTYLA